MQTVRDYLVVGVLLGVVTSTFATEDSPTELIGVAFKTRSDAASYTPSAVLTQSTWDLNTDVKIVQPDDPDEGDRQKNCFGQWQYGFGMTNQPFGFVPAKYKFNPGNSIELFGDVEEGTPIQGFIYYNDTGAIDCCGIDDAMHGISLGSNLHPAKIRWTAPEAISISLTGVFTGGSGGQVSVMIIKNNAEILFQKDQISDPGMQGTEDIPFDLNTTVDKGDTIDFALVNADNVGISHTGLDATIAATNSEEYWNGAGFGGNFGSAWIEAGSAGFTATYEFPTTETEWDLYLQIKTGPDLATDLPFQINFQPAESFHISPDERIVSTDSSEAESGVVVCVVDTSGPEFPNTEFVYLGRFGFGEGTGSVVCDVENATAGSTVHTPVTLWVAPVQANFGDLAYNDYNSVPAGWFTFGDTVFDHYQWNATDNRDVLRASQFFPFPPGDRTGRGDMFDVTYRHYDIDHPQVGQIPLTIYFKPAGAFRAPDPSDSPFITRVDTSNAVNGRVVIEVLYSQETVENPPYPENDVPMGSYEMEPGTLYGLKVNNFISQLPFGDTIGPEVVLLTPASLGNARPGDVNNNGVLDSADPVKLLRAIFLGDNLPCSTDESNTELLDFDGSGGIGLEITSDAIDDALAMLEHLFNGAPGHPLGPLCIDSPDCPDMCR